MAEKKKVEVKIDGRNFTVVGSNSENYVMELAHYVDSKIKNLTSKNDRLSQTMSATLAALNIADELKNSEMKLQELENQSKEPMEKYENVITELELSKATIEELKLECIKYKDELLKSKLDSENTTQNVKKHNHSLEIKEKELINSQRMIKSLQDKIFENQIELIETKKELEELIKKVDIENKDFIKEEV